MPYYDLNGQPIDLWAWCRLFETASRIPPGEPGTRYIAEDNVELPGGDHAHVSTVWLGINHNWGTGVPLIFETMIFWETGNYGSDDYQVRTPTREAALAAHDQAVEHARNLGQVLAKDREDS